MAKQAIFPSIWWSFWLISFFVYLGFGLQPAEAKNYLVSGQLEIPSISLKTDTTSLTLENGELQTPEGLVGSFTNSENKTLLIGHSSQIFQNLSRVQIGQPIIYLGAMYSVSDIQVLPKTDIKMSELLKPAAQPTIILMTCAGEPITDYDFTERLLITATREVSL